MSDIETQAGKLAAALFVMFDTAVKRSSPKQDAQIMALVVFIDHALDRTELTQEEFIEYWNSYLQSGAKNVRRTMS